MQDEPNPTPARRTRWWRSARRVEWPTWLLIAAVYGGWAAAASRHRALGPVAGCALLALLTCWYMSLQHELLHGHPTRWRRLNRLFGLLPLAVWYPYDIYRQTHLAHHRDELLTEPGIDPESNYLAAHQLAALPRGCRPLWFAQRTVLGRVLIGPAMTIVPLWRDIVARPLRGDRSQCGLWLQHLLLLAALLAALDRWAGIGPLQYAFGVGYPALGLAMLRSFYEHRPAAQAAHRVVLNEAGLFWRVLYLDNNYHALHHEMPQLPWYRLGQRYRADGAALRARNGGFVVPGYGTLLRRYAWRMVDSPIHPGR